MTVDINKKWCKVIFNETPTKSNVKQGYLYDEGEFFKIVGDKSTSYIRKSNIISITVKNET